MTKGDKSIAIWLLVMCGMVFLMIIVGGITRLTESGLSMVNWQPLSGVIPPLSEAAWTAEFDTYKQFPEYIKVNDAMTLGEFKAIFYWEYSHRLLGRLIGVVFFVPFMIFLFRGMVKPDLKPKLWVMFVLGGLQGVLGWWMVKSGLVDDPDVSHYRLTAHLGLAVLIYVYMLWVAFDLILSGCKNVAEGLYFPALLLVKLIFAQILLGGLVAGLNAGFVYTDWPMMDGALIPEGLFDMVPWYANFTENTMTVQFDHRLLGYIITVLGIFIWWKLRTTSISRAGHILLASILLQVTLGILTLINVVPIPLAALHQAGAIIALSASLYLLNRVRP